jgi:hypothetical protein
MTERALVWLAHQTVDSLLGMSSVEPPCSIIKEELPLSRLKQAS